MKMWRWFLILLVLTLVISACNTGETTSGDPEENSFPAKTQIIDDGITPMPTSGETGPGGEIITGEEPPEVIPAVEQPEGQVIDAPMMLSSLFILEVAGQTGKVANIEGVILDALNGQMQYLVLSAHGPKPEREILLPWGAFYVVSFPTDVETEGMGPDPVVWMKVSEDLFADAPDFDPTVFSASDGPSANWDAESRSYWTSVMPDLPVTGDEGNEAPPAPLNIEGPRMGGIEIPAVDRDGENLGLIEDIVFDQQGRAIFVILKPGETFDPGSERVPVAWKAFTWMPDEQAFMLQVAPSTLDSAPRLDPQDLPDTTLPGWEDEWQQYWQDAEPAPARTPSPETGSGTVLFTGLQQQPVTSQTGQPVGHLEDWIADFGGQSYFAVILVDEKFIPLPWQLLDWLDEDERETLEMIQEYSIITNAPSYGSLDDLIGEPDWYQPVADYWSKHIEIAQTDNPSSLMLVSAGQLIENEVVGPDGDRLGTVEDVLIDSEGQIPYFLISMGDRLIPVPWINFEYSNENGELVYLDDIERLTDAPSFRSPEDFDPSELGWDSEIRSYWGMEQD